MSEEARRIVEERDLTGVTAGCVLDVGDGRYVVRGRTDDYILAPWEGHPSGFKCECSHYIYRCADSGAPCRHIRDLEEFLRRRRAAAYLDEHPLQEALA